MFLLDENISSPPIANALRELNDWQIEIHTDHLLRGAFDKDVVALCGSRGWSLVTCDEMRYTPETKASMVSWGVCVFKVVIHRQTRGVEIASALIAGRKRILDMLERQPSPFCAHVHLNGSLNLMSDLKDISLTEAQRRTFRKFRTVVNY